MDGVKTRGEMTIRTIAAMTVTVPLTEVQVKSDFYDGRLTVGIVDSLPYNDVQFLLGNDFLNKDTETNIEMNEEDTEDLRKRACAKLDRSETLALNIESPEIACVMTRAMAKKKKADHKNIDACVLQTQGGNKESFSGSEKMFPGVDVSMDTADLVERQRSDTSIGYAYKNLIERGDIQNHNKCFYLHNDILMRKTFLQNDKDFVSPLYQIVLPKADRSKVLSIAHDTAHFGIRKTIHQVKNSFFWPKMKRDIQDYVNSCEACQFAMKTSIPKYVLKPIRFEGEPFSKLMIDCVGPLPKTKQKNEFIFTIICPITKFVEAFPLRNIRAKTILKCLFKFFSTYGLPLEVYSDNGSNFRSQVFRESLKSLGIKQFFSTILHPETQGSLERFHKSMKGLLRSFCIENKKSWDENLHLVTMASRSFRHDSTGFAPNELVFGHKVRGPLDLLKHNILSNKGMVTNVLDYVTMFKTKLFECLELAKKNIGSSQDKMKHYFDKKCKVREFGVDDKVLIFLPTNSSPFEAKLCGPYTILKRINDRNYLVSTPDRKKKRQVFHVNMLKLFHEKENCMANENNEPLHTVTEIKPDNNENACLLMNHDKVYDCFGANLCTQNELLNDICDNINNDDKHFCGNDTNCNISELEKSNSGTQVLIFQNANFSSSLDSVNSDFGAEDRSTSRSSMPGGNYQRAKHGAVYATDLSSNETSRRSSTLPTRNRYGATVLSTEPAHDSTSAGTVCTSRKSAHVGSQRNTNCAVPVRLTEASCPDAPEHMPSSNKGNVFINCNDSPEAVTCSISQNRSIDSHELDKVHKYIDTELSHLDSNQKSDMADLLIDYSNTFTDVAKPSQLKEYKIQLKNDTPIQKPPYRMHPDKKKELRKEVNKLLEDDIIRESSSNYSSPCFLVKKSNGSWRLVIDYRYLNENVIVEQYPLPLIEEILDRVAAANFISTFDMKAGYHQVLLSEESKHLTAFATPFGLYEFNRLPFGMSSCPQAFQKRLNGTFRNMDDFCYVYIDDIVVFSDSWHDHVQHLRTVFQKIDEYQIGLNLDKVSLAKNSLTYLGFQIGQGQIEILSAKVQPILSYAVPKNKKDLQRLLGLVNYFRKFIPNYSGIAAPLTDLLKTKEKSLKWTEKHTDILNDIKQRLSNPPILRAPDYSSPFHLFVDASNVAVGSMLAQKYDNEFLPVAYFSKKLSAPQQNYATIERELLGLILSLEHFDSYLGYENTIFVHTDHNPLVFINRMMNKNARLTRWALQLQKYRLEISHIPGRLNCVADALSRGF